MYWGCVLPQTTRFVFSFREQKRCGFTEQFVDVLAMACPWKSLLLVGDRHARGALFTEAGLRAVWRVLMPSDAVDWLQEQPASPSLSLAMHKFGEIWWGYLCWLRQNEYGDVAPHTASVVEFGCAQLRASPRCRSAFAALLFQLVVTERHDQSVCSVQRDPCRPPFYDHRVSRSKVASMFSLSDLLCCEERYACARRTVEMFRGIRGRLVAEVYDAGGTELIRRPRSKLRRWCCSKCEKKPRSNCTRCTRLQEHTPDALVSYYGHNHDWVPVADVQTVCGDVLFVPSKAVRPGAVVASHGESGAEHWTVVKTTRGANEGVKLTGHSSKGDSTTKAWCGDSKSVVPVLPCASDCARMLSENPFLVRGMCMSVSVDKYLRYRWAKCSTPVSASFLSMSTGWVSEQDARGRALWCGLAAFVSASAEACGAGSKAMRTALRSADKVLLCSQAAV